MALIMWVSILLRNTIKQYQVLSGIHATARKAHKFHELNSVVCEASNNTQLVVLPRTKLSGI